MEKNNIKNFYNETADKFAQTRQKFWPEFLYIKKEIENIIKQKSKIKILELWCWSWRLYKYLQENFAKEVIEYKWIDISEKLIEIANKTWWDFEIADMLEFLEKQEQQSFDLIIAVASFQHIFSYKERLLIMKNIYRILNYDGKIIMFNWAFSYWFLKKYILLILKSFLIWILTFFTKPINDVFITWKQDWKIYYRYYHIFLLFELKKLAKMSWFIIQELCYISQTWEKTISLKKARNSMIIWKKSIMYI